MVHESKQSKHLFTLMLLLVLVFDDYPQAVVTV